MEAAAAAHLRTGVPITTHTHAPSRNGRDQLAFFVERGVAPDRLVIGHCGDSEDLDYLRELMDAGATIGMDRFGMEHVLPDTARIATVQALLREGYADRMVLSHDAAYFSRVTPPSWRAAHAPHWHMENISRRILPALLSRRRHRGPAAPDDGPQPGPHPHTLRSGGMTMRTSIATVCLSGTLTEKLHAAADAGFDGVELFEPDLVASPASPQEVVALAGKLGLSLDLYQPFRDAEGVDEEEFQRVLRRARAKFVLMGRLGIDTMLVCSNVGTATIDDDAVSAGQLRRLGDEAAGYGIRLAFEALAWGRYVDDYRRAWRIVDLADHDAVGVCLDSFHILSRGHDPAAIEDIPGSKIFFLQLADAPALTMDVLSWSRHHRLFPGEGTFDLGAFVGHVLTAGYTGPLSLEVFNDVFRQTDVVRTARQARRSLTWLEDLVAGRSWVGLADPPASLPGVSQPETFDFVEVRAEDTGEVDVLLEQLGFTFRGRHRSKDARLWTEGPARVVCNEQHARDRAPTLAAVGFEVREPSVSAKRAQALGAPTVYRRTLAREQELPAFRAPDGTEVFLGPVATGRDAPWVPEFSGGYEPPSALLTGIDHVNLAEPWQCFDEAVLFYSSVLGLAPEASQEVPSPNGLVRSQVVRTTSGSCRLALNVAPLAWDAAGGFPQHVAFSTSDIVTVARRAVDRGLTPLAIPRNYYDDLIARFDLPPAEIETMAALGLLHDRDATGDFTHFYTATVGAVFFEVVQRRGTYEGYGAPNAGVRLAAQHRGPRQPTSGDV